MAKNRNFWLLKTEPTSYSIQDLAAEDKQTTCWDGVRNYQARNFIRDEMRVGDGVLVYHSNADPPAIVGTARVVRSAYPDHSAWDRKSQYFDEKSTPDNPRWFVVDIQLKDVFRDPIPLSRLREETALGEMELLRKGSRLSVQPVRKAEFDHVLKMSRRQR